METNRLQPRHNPHHFVIKDIVMEKIIKQSFRAITSITAFLFLTACIPLGRMPLEIPLRQNIHKSQAIVSTHQDNLIVQPTESQPVYPTGLGVTGVLVGAAVNGAIVANQNALDIQLFAPLRNSLEGEHFDEQMHQEVVHSLKPIPWLHLENKNALMKVLDNGEKTTLTQHAKGDALIFVDFSYQLSARAYDALIVKADVQIYKKQTPKAVLIYKNDFKYIDQLHAPKSNTDNMRRWTENNGAYTRQAMYSAIELLSMAIAKDIADAKRRPNPKRPTNVWYTDYPHEAMGYLERKIGDKAIIRDSYGDITIVNVGFVKTKHNWRE